MSDNPAPRPMTTEEWYSGPYQDLQSKGLQGWYIRRAHAALERQLGALPAHCDVLEIGGDEGQHLAFVTHPFRSYTITDSRDVRLTSGDPRVRCEVADAERLPYPDAAFDRAVVTCVLHHVANPEAAIHELRRVTKPGGLISVQIPCDPGLVYRIGKLVGPYRTLRRKYPEQDPRYFHYLEHRNHFAALDALLHEATRNDDVQSTYWPIPLRSWNANLFVVHQIRRGADR